MRLRHFVLIVAAVTALVSNPSASADANYRAEISGAEDSERASLLDKVSELKTLEDKPPVSEEALRRRADRDLQRLADAAHSLGYWDADSRTTSTPRRDRGGNRYRILERSICQFFRLPTELPCQKRVISTSPGAPSRFRPFGNVACDGPGNSAFRASLTPLEVWSVSRASIGAKSAPQEFRPS
jgi:hypothetical protein